MYDPFARGAFTVAERAFQALDVSRNRTFPCVIWHPAQKGIYPLILLSHASGGGSRAYTFLSTHLASHGYIVAALDHSELVSPELARKGNETPEQKIERVESVVAGRIPDIRFLLEHLLRAELIQPMSVGIMGHSFGGWTALAATGLMRDIEAVAAFAPGGSSNPRPGMLRLKLDFAWNRNVPALILAAENDVSLPLDGMYEIFDRIPSDKRMFVLRRADHMHFMDNVEQIHESVRAMPPWSEELAYLQKEMRPIKELCTGEQAHLFARGLTVAHFDASLKGRLEAHRLLDTDAERELAARSVDAFAHKGTPREPQQQSKVP